MSDVIAYYTDEAVTVDDLKYQMYLLKNEDRKKAVVQHLIQEYICRDARSQGLAPDVTRVEDRMEQLRDDPGYYDMLRELKMDENAMRVYIERDELVSAWIDRVTRVTEVESLEWYETRLANIVKPAMAKGRHILITINDEFVENRRDAVMRKMAEIQCSTEPFEKLAERYSECPTALNGGDLGWVRKETVYPEIAEVLFNSPPMSKPVVVETEMGIHLVQCVDFRPAAAIGMEEGMVAARKQVKERKSRMRLNEVLKTILARIKFVEEG